MPITAAQTAAALEVMSALLLVTAPRGKRQLAGMFLDLVDRTDWPQYYEVIPEPRCLNNVKNGIEKGRYKNASDIYTDLSLVFWNALFYNEPASQISLDANTLKTTLETEWKARSVLPTPRTSPPPASPQKVHKVDENSTGKPLASATTLTQATPQTRSTPVPTTTTGTSSHGKPVASRSKISQMSTEMDVDVVSEDGLDASSTAMERDLESEEIVQQLEKGLPRWPGHSDEGWAEDISQDRIIEVVHVIKSHKDVVGNRLAVSLEAVPEEPTTIPYLSFTAPLSLKSIESRARAKNYESSKDFDKEMIYLFERGRRWHKPGTAPYGHVLLLQRLYQALVSSGPPSGPPYTSNTNFAALGAGPGTVKPVFAPDAEGVTGVTSHQITTKDRTFVDEIHYKGWTLKLADWVHLSNPDDPSRPIVGQVFKCWIVDEGTRKGESGLSVSWYYRPEQTFHPSNRMFWEGEVFKTDHFADHPLEDIIEKIACQFTARHIRGRPRPPYWYLGFPLYVCDTRYSDRDRTFEKIKDWISCMPDEVPKGEEFMPIYPFERLIMPNRMPSPFSGRTVKGPGGPVTSGAGDVPVIEPHQENDNQGNNSQTGTTPANVRNLRSRRNQGGADQGPSNNSSTTAGAAATSTTTSTTKGYVGATNRSSVQPSANATAVPPFHHQTSNLSNQGQQVQAGQKPSVADRSIVTAAGGTQGALTEKLPPETAKHFDRDPETNEVLWFPAPPVDIARPVKPKYSLAYLHFLATKRKREEGISDGDGQFMEVDSDSAASSPKRSRPNVPPTVTETLLAVMREFGVA